VNGLVFRTAFIVGHPGETDEDFAELVEFVKWARFDRVGVFRFSDEESAPSFHLDDKVPAKVSAARFRKLMTAQRKIAHARNDELVDKVVEVIVEGTSDEHEYVMMGRHAGQAPGIDGQVYLSSEGGVIPRSGELRRVRITQASDYDLVGDLVDEPPIVAARAPSKQTKQRDGKISLRVVSLLKREKLRLARALTVARGLYFSAERENVSARECSTSAPLAFAC
jgi:ribosomal protein S12 methylthiotransferase